MTTNPLVSVVIPCFNAQRFVADAVRSALEQTYAHVEVIVVDDGSVDGTADVLRSFGTAIRWTTGPNRGAPSARNQGMSMARGDVLQFLDADDILYPRKLDEQVPVLIDTQADSVWCSVEMAPFEGEIGARPHAPWKASQHDDAVVVALGQNPGTSSPIHARGIIERIGGFRTELRCAQDRDLHLRAACAGATFGYFPGTLVTKRRRPNSLSADSGKVLAEYERVIPPAYNDLVASGQMTEARAVAFAGFMAKAARWCIRLGDQARASQYLETARKMHRGRGIATAYGSRLAPVRRLVGPWHAERAARCVQAVRRVLPFGGRQNV